MNLIDRHLAWCERRELRPSYLGEIRTTLRRVEREVGALEEATEAQIEAWWAALTGVGPGARVAYAAHLSSFYRWLIHERLRDDDPTARLIRPRLQRGIPRPISDKSLDRALAGAGQPVRTWLALASYMGFRACEIANLCREDVRADLGVIVLHGKGGKQRTVPLHPQVARYLEFGPDTGPLFLARGGKRPLSPNAVSQRANRYLHDVGIPETLHQLRHWFGTNVYRASNDLRLTQELMGHSSPTTTAGYAAWAPERAAGVVGALTISGEPELDPAA